MHFSQLWSPISRHTDEGHHATSSHGREGNGKAAKTERAGELQENHSAVWEPITPTTVLTHPQGQNFQDLVIFSIFAVHGMSPEQAFPSESHALTLHLGILVWGYSTTKSHPQPLAERS